MKTQPKFAIILFGDPASGKNTQAKFLQKKYKAKVFSSGDALRILEKTNPKYKQILSKTLDTGSFVPAKIYENIFINFLNEISNTKSNILLNGNPRMSTEADFVLKKLHLLGINKIIAIYLKIPKAEIIKRTAIRVEKEHRKDDAFVSKRILEHKKHMASLFIFLKNKHIPTKRIDGLGSVKEVNEKIFSAVDKLLSVKGKNTI